MFWELNNIIKLNLKLNRKKIDVNLNKKGLNLVKQFISLNIVKLIKKINNDKQCYKNKTYTIIFNKNSKVKVIQNWYKPSHKKIINIRNLKKITLKKNNFLIISTSSGIINSNRAVKLRKGGVLITNLLI